jgi:cell wall assembly regulator SMI1
MKAIWQRIHFWLTKNAPKGYGCLRPGSTAEAIQAAETSMGLKLPADYKASCRIHDGQDKEAGLIGGEGWLLTPLSDVVKNWRKWFRADPKYATRIPIAWVGTGDYVFINLDAAAEEPGSLMVQRRDSAEPDPLAPSFRAWLEEFADQLDDGEFAYSEEDGEVMYANEIDLD